MSKFVSHIHNRAIIVIKLTSMILSIPQNRLIGYIVTLIHSDKLLWENVMNYAALYSLKCLFEGGGCCWFLTYISVKIGLIHP